MAVAVGDAAGGPVTEADPARLLYRSIESGFVRAAAALGTVVRTVPVPGGSARFEFAGERLARVLGAGLATRSGDAAEAPVFLARTWESWTSGVGAPSVPPPVAGRPTPIPARHGQVDTWIGTRFRATVTPGSRTAMVWDEVSRSAVAWTASPETVAPWEAAAPLRSAWAWWAEATGAALAHGAAVGDASGAVLLAGPGGSGKSTTALACLRQGMRFAGDDYVLVRAEPPRVFGLFPTAKLLPEDLAARLAAFETLALPHDPRSAKRVVVLAGPLRAQFAEAMPLRAIVVPSVARDGRVSLRSMSPGAVLRAIGPPSVLQIRGTGAAAFRQLAALAGRLPAFALDVGPDLGAVVEAVRHALREAARA